MDGDSTRSGPRRQVRGAASAGPVSMCCSRRMVADLSAQRKRCRTLRYSSWHDLTHPHAGALRSYTSANLPQARDLDFDEVTAEIAQKKGSGPTAVGRTEPHAPKS